MIDVPAVTQLTEAVINTIYSTLFSVCTTFFSHSNILSAGEPRKQSDVRVFVTVGRDTNRPPRFRQRDYMARVREDADPG